MYDDGSHNDGIAGDNVYGAAFTMFTSQVQYYIYAENSNAGMFSPERAEHEFYTVLASAQNPTPGQVVINEFLAQNQNVNINEYGQHQDWIELYNTTSSPLNLFGLYLTDNYSNPTKFSFPPNSIIPANGYFMLWADQEVTTSSYVHCNFKLGAGGEQLMLSNSSGTVIDSVTYGVQSADNSTGRCPNGTGSFIKLIVPSFNALNCVTGIDDIVTESEIKIYPNPANTQITIEFDSKRSENTVEIYTTLGQQLLLKKFGTGNGSVDISEFDNGIYLVKINKEHYKKIEILH
jgi:hypothetical protein